MRLRVLSENNLSLSFQLYELQVFEGSSDPITFTTIPRGEIDINRLSIRSEELLPSTEYSCRVRAQNAAGFGPFSDPVHFKTANGGPETPPHSLQVEINEANTAVLSWKHPNCTSPVDVSICFFENCKIYRAMSFMLQEILVFQMKISTTGKLWRCPST